MNWKLGTRERILRKKKWRDVAVSESVQSCFELSMHLSVFFSGELFLVAVHGWFATGLETGARKKEREPVDIL